MKLLMHIELDADIKCLTKNREQEERIYREVATNQIKLLKDIYSEIEVKKLSIEVKFKENL